MSKVFISIFFLVSLITNNALAAHGHRTEKCSSISHEFVYEGNYSLGGMYSISLTGNELVVSALPLIELETPNTLNDADIIFVEKSSSIFDKIEISKNGDYEHREWNSAKVIEINLISNDASKKIGLKQGDKLSLLCLESSDFPMMNECI
jgi:hypothetical protein